MKLKDYKDYAQYLTDEQNVNFEQTGFLLEISRPCISDIGKSIIGGGGIFIYSCLHTLTTIAF